MIRKATTEDLVAIRKWLLEDTCGDYPRIILNSWDEDIEQPFDSGKLLVYCIEAEPVAFMTGGPESDFHLVVRRDLRGRGIGRKLVQYVLDRESRKGETLWYFKIRTESRPFWEKMGFNITYKANKEKPEWTLYYAWRNIERNLTVPPKGDDVRVEFRFRRCEKIEFAKESICRAIAKPVRVLCITGKFVPKSNSRGTIYFPSQVQFNFGEFLDFDHDPLYDWNEIRVQILINGIRLVNRIRENLKSGTRGKSVHAGWRTDKLELGKRQVEMIFGQPNHPYKQS